MHIIDSLAPGGTQSVLKTYLETAKETDHVLYALRRVPDELDIRHPGIYVEPSPSRISLMPLFSLRRLIEGQGVYLLHCHLFRSQVFGYLLKRLFFPQVALIFHEHGRVVGRENEPRIEGIAYHMFLKLAVRHVDRFLCISDFVRTKLLDVIPDAVNRVTVIPNPISPPVAILDPNAHDAARREMGIPGDAFVVGFAARLVARKGWRDFLNAMSLLAAEIPLFYLLAGDGEERDAVRKVIESTGLQHHGRLLGHMQNMSHFYSVLDCLVMPSHWEPHGLSHLEAQSYGVPVVVSDVPGMNGTVQHDVDALLFPPGDALAMAAQVRHIATDPLLRTRISECALANAARFTPQEFARHIDGVYSAFCGSAIAPARISQ